MTTPDCQHSFPHRLVSHYALHQESLLLNIHQSDSSFRLPLRCPNVQSGNPAPRSADFRARKWTPNTPKSRPYILLCEIVLRDCDLLLYYAFPHTLLLTYMITCDILHTSCGIALCGPRQSGSTGFHRDIAMLYKTPCLSFRSIFCRNSHSIFDLLFATFYLLHNLSPPRP
jgi:hypothetical protein